MATQRPLINTGGDPAEIATGDTIDPAFLPASTASVSRAFPYFIA